MEFGHLPHVNQMDAMTFDELMLRYGQDVWNYAFFITKRRDLADDITQEVFLRAYRNVGEFRGESTVKTWLLKITRNLSFSTRKSAFFSRVFVTASLGERGASPSAESEYLARAASDEIWLAVMSLPLKFREVLLLEIKSDMSMREIAFLLGISEGTAKSRLHRARAKVTAILKEGKEDEYRTTGLVR